MTGREALPLEFYHRPTLEVARDLLGRTLCRKLERGKILRGRLVEVEAYDGFRDRASHAHRGPTRRSAPMFEAGGIAYVYLIYGLHHCLNVVTGAEGFPAAVLIRAAESPRDDRSASGPGRLTRAFEIDLSMNRSSFVGPDLWLEAGDPPPRRRIRRTPRIGVDYAGAWAGRPYRFLIDGDPAVSR